MQFTSMPQIFNISFMVSFIGCKLPISVLTLTVQYPKCCRLVLITIISIIKLLILNYTTWIALEELEGLQCPYVMSVSIRDA